MKIALSILAASSLLITTGCAELQEIAEEHKAEQAAEEAKKNRIRTLDIDQPIANLSVEAISEEFEANSVMAENKYMNQPVELTGYIGSIDDSLFDEKNVNITITSGEYSLASVSCSKPRSAPEVRELRKGMRVAVRGVITSEEMGIGLSRCKFWSFSQDRWIGGNQRRREKSEQAQKATLSNLEQINQNSLTSEKATSAIPDGKARFYSDTTGKTEIFGVKLTSRKNQNGETVVDAEWEDGLKSTYVFWKSGIVEILSKDGEGKIDNMPGTWTANDGDVSITSKSGSVTTFPNLNPPIN